MNTDIAYIKFGPNGYGSVYVSMVKATRDIMGNNIRQARDLLVDYCRMMNVRNLYKGEIGRQYFPDVESMTVREVRDYLTFLYEVAALLAAVDNYIVNSVFDQEV